MFEVYETKTGEVIALAEEPRYVYRNPKNGVWIRCEEPKAECIAVSGVRYSISGRAEVEDAAGTVAVRKVDGAKRIAELAKGQVAHAETLDEVKAAYTDMAEAVLDLYALDSEDRSDLDERYAYLVDEILKFYAPQTQV